ESVVARPTPRIRNAPACARSGEEPASSDSAYPLLSVDLDDVTLLDVSEALEEDTALVTSRDFLCIVLEAAKSADCAVVHHLFLPQHASRGSSDRTSVDHKAAGDEAALADSEDLAYLGVPQDNLLVARLQ